MKASTWLLTACALAVTAAVLLLVVFTLTGRSCAASPSAHPATAITFSKWGRLGQLGNQLFQAAACLHHGRTVGLPVLLPRPQRQTKLFFKLFDAGRVEGIQWVSGPTVHWGDKQRKISTLKEPVVEYRPLRLDAPAIHRDAEEAKRRGRPYRLNLKGYFQTLEDIGHGDGAQRELARMFTPRAEVLTQARARVDFTMNLVIVMHVRMGDYRSVFHRNNFVQLSATTYYERAMGHVTQTLQRTSERQRVVLCIVTNSNRDHDTVAASGFMANIREEYLATGKVDDIVHVRDSSPEVDYALLYLSHAAIIANSTFSWWAAYTSEARKQGIVAPWPWYPRVARSEGLARKLLPSSWHVVMVDS